MVQAEEMFSGALAGAQQEVADALDLAGGQRGYTREQVDEVRMVLRLGPILLLSVAYWTIYTQMASVFVLQVRPRVSSPHHPDVCQVCRAVGVSE